MHALQKLTETQVAGRDDIAHPHPCKVCTWCSKVRIWATRQEWERPLLVVDRHSEGQVAHIHVVEQLRDVGGLVVDVRLHAQMRL